MAEFCARKELVVLLSQGKILIGHSIHNDLHVLKIQHPRSCVRDTAKCKIIRDLACSKASQQFGLKTLAKLLLREYRLPKPVQTFRLSAAKPVRSCGVMYVSSSRNLPPPTLTWPDNLCCCEIQSCCGKSDVSAYLLRTSFASHVSTPTFICTTSVPVLGLSQGSYLVVRWELPGSFQSLQPEKVHCCALWDFFMCNK